MNWVRDVVLGEKEWAYWQADLFEGDATAWEFVNFKINKFHHGYPGPIMVAAPEVWRQLPMKGGGASEGSGGGGEGGGGGHGGGGGEGSGGGGGDGEGSGGQAPPPWKKQRQARGGKHVQWHNAKYQAQKAGRLTEFLRANPDPRHP